MLSVGLRKSLVELKRRFNKIRSMNLQPLGLVTRRWSQITTSLAIFIGLAIVGYLSSPVAAQSTMAVPAGFQDSLVANISSPTALAFTPDGRLLITTQAGALRIYQNGNLLSTPALNLASVLCSDFERGLLGVAVDPNFATNHFIYLYYTHKKFGSCPYNNANSPVNRVSRFVLADNNIVAPSSEVVLLDNIPSPNGNHNAGDLHFGADGLLYVSVGDGGCDYAGGGCGGSNNAARDQHVLLGKILRITRDGGIPATNPFQGSNSVRCNVTGPTTPGKQCQETFAWGLRNPFRFAFRPGSNQFYINDVGQGQWEEIDEGQAGADYGWNVREGHCANGSITNCGPPPAGMTNPIYDYGRATNCASITGGAFVPLGIWPASYDNTYLFSDYVCGKIFQLVPSGGGGFTATEFATGLGGNSAVAMIFGPHNTTQALYYTTYAGGGQVRRIAYLGSANRPPTAAISANPTFGNPPLSVSFNAAGSSDPDGDPMTFDWNFGDGTSLTGTTNPTPTHTYTTSGVYTAALTARDNRGGVSLPATVRIDVNNAPPKPKITAPNPELLFRVGQTLTLKGRATDREDGSLPASALTWTVLLHHIDQANPDTAHTHRLLGPITGTNIAFTAPPPEDLAAAALSYLELQLTATDSAGRTATITQTLQPRRIDLTFVTEPPGLNLIINGNTITTPQTFVSWHRYQLNVDVPTPQVDGSGQTWEFSQWSDGRKQAHTITTPSISTTYTATFKQPSSLGLDTRVPNSIWLPIVLK
jgi:glucose/arabinose dehydrogenase